MPVTVQELNINTTVQNEGKEGKNASSSGQDGAAPNKKDKEQIIQECIRRILELMEYQRGR